MRTTLVAFDGSTHALNAVKEAQKYQQLFPDAHVTLLKVLKVSEAKDQCLDLSLSEEEKNGYGFKQLKKKLLDY